MANNSKKQESFLLLDNDCMPLGRAIREPYPASENWYMRVFDDKAEAVARVGTVQIVNLSVDSATVIGKVVEQRRDLVILTPIGTNVRQNLRVSVQFMSYIYFDKPGNHRAPIVSRDLSSSGVHFYCQELLGKGEQMEIVIPVTPQPLVVKCEILRSEPGSSGKFRLYAAKFVDLLDEEAAMIRGAVFGIQIRNHTAGNQKAIRK